MTSRFEVNGLRFDMYTGGQKDLVPNAVIMSGRKDIVLFDVGFVPSEVKRLITMIKDTGKRLRAAVITHAHPDHYAGMSEIRRAFPDVPILARQGVIDGILEWPAKRVHWQEMYGDDLPPADLAPPAPLKGETLYLEDREIVLVDLPVAETVHATAFYIPSARAFIAGDLLYNDLHLYLADTNNPTSWISAIELSRNLGAIDLVFPGHGPAGGTEIFDKNVRWLEDYREVAKPGVRVAEIAKTMTKRYPEYGLAILLWLTRGPGFALCGARELGVPAELMGG
jgi:glyoxylase-like metal-dependent hydrolase (beta-lactamase superfamily II)